MRRKSRAAREVQRLRDENAKLRELARDLYRVCWACDSSKCPYGSECDNDPDEFKPNCRFKDVMRELGVEVNDG